VLNTLRVLLLLSFCISQGSGVTRLSCGENYDINIVENLPLSPRAKEFLNSANISQSYE